MPSRREFSAAKGGKDSRVEGKPSALILPDLSLPVKLLAHEFQDLSDARPCGPAATIIPAALDLKYRLLRRLCRARLDQVPPNILYHEEYTIW